MNVDMTQPWVESQEKKPKIGEVIAEIINLQNDKTAEDEELVIRLEQVNADVTERLKVFKNNVDGEIDAHTSKDGPAHNETADTIGLGLKENLPVADIKDLKNDVYKREWCTPQLLAYILANNLKANTDDYMTSGRLPLSSGRLLGKTYTNQIFHTEDTTISDSPSIGQVSYLLSTEESYVMFAEYGQGRITNFSEGGERAPIGVTNIDIRNGFIYPAKGQPVSLNNLTTSGKFAKKVTGLAWGLGQYNGNFYDSNFHPTVEVVDEEDDGSAIQEVEASLFDPTMVYKPNGDFYARNVDTTKHNFNELFLNKDGNYPFNNSIFLSSDDFMSHIANTQLIKQSNRWGIQFDFLTGNVGISDWLPESLTKATDKILSRQATYTIKNTLTTGITGFNSASSLNTLGSNLPWGYENRGNFDNSNFVSGATYSTIFLPINDLINGFDSLSAANQQKFIDAVNTDLLVRISRAWDNEYTKTGVLRIPFYYDVPNTEKAWCAYIDMSYTIAIGENSNTVTFKALNWDNSKKPTINAQLDLTNPTGSRYVQWGQTVEDTPLHPKVFKGCFVETGGHITAYVVGHRQYICYYQHAITSVRQWIMSDITPVITEDEKISDVCMFPGNRFYSDNTRMLPLSFTDTAITYLSRMRDKYGKYRYGTFTTDLTTFDLLSTRESEASEVNWLNKKTNRNIPILIDNSNLRSEGINTTALVFSETNGFIGYRDHGFNGDGFTPDGVTEIENALKTRITLGSEIVNPYAIFFYFNEMLYWAIVSRDGTKNDNGYDGCVGGIRVDMLYDGSSYTIRSLPDLNPKYAWGKVFEDYPSGLIRGRESESFDDVYIVNKTGVDKTTYVFVNYPDLDGRYYSFEITADENGYYYPSAFTPRVINLKEESGYGVSSPHAFYGSYFAPFMLIDKFYLPQSDIYTLTKYTIDSVETVRDYYMGWSNEQPLYAMGEHITVNGKSLLLNRNLTIPIKNHTHSGRVFISYYNETFDIYSTGENPLGSPTEPDNAVIFAGYWEKIGDDYILNFHAPRGIANNVSMDFINSLLPIIDGKQMAIDSMGSTFPAVLGKLTGVPRQYYFKK